MVGDFAYRPPADGGDARNRQQIGDECVRAFGVGADERREHALIFRPGICRADSEPIEILRQRCLMIEILDQPPLPRGCEIKHRDKGAKQGYIAHANVRRGEAVMRRRLKSERQHFGIRGCDILPAEGFDAGLQEFAAAVAAMTKHRPEIAKTARLAGFGRGEVVARDRNGEVGAQTQFAPLGVARQIHALADVLAGKVEERLGWLQDRRRHPRIARALERGDERVGARIGRGLRRDHFCTRHGANRNGSEPVAGGALARLGGLFDAKARTGLTTSSRVCGPRSAYRQSPSTAPTSARAARGGGGGGGSRTAFGNFRSAARSSGAKPPSGPTSTASGGACPWRVCRACASAATGSFTSAVSSQNTSRRSGSSSAIIRSRLSGARISGSVRMPHCSAASIAFARMRSRLTRATWAWRVRTGCSREAPISTAFWVM